MLKGLWDWIRYRGRPPIFVTFGLGRTIVAAGAYTRGPLAGKGVVYIHLRANGVSGTDVPPDEIAAYNRLRRNMLVFFFPTREQALDVARALIWKASDRSPEGTTEGHVTPEHGDGIITGEHDCLDKESVPGR